MFGYAQAPSHKDIEFEAGARIIVILGRLISSQTKRLFAPASIDRTMSTIDLRHYPESPKF